MTFPERPLGDVISPAAADVLVDPSAVYAIAGVYGYGRGLFKREPIKGSETSYQRLNKLSAGRLVMSRLKAFEGAIALVGDEFDGYYLSPEFPTFDIDGNKADPRYLAHICAWPGFWSRLSAQAKGLGARKVRVSAKRLLEVRVPLPEVEEQRRIVEILRMRIAICDRLSRARLANEKMSRCEIDEKVSLIYRRGAESGWRLVKLGDIADLNPRVRRAKRDEKVLFVPMAAVDKGTGKISGAAYIDGSEIRAGYKRFERNDVIFARITPCMQNGKSAVFSDVGAELGIGSTEFHVIRSNGDVLPEYIHRFVRTRKFLKAAQTAFAGTAGHQRVPVNFLARAEIPIPASVDEQRKCVMKVDALMGKATRLAELMDRQMLMYTELRNSILNDAFSGKL